MWKKILVTILVVLFVALPAQAFVYTLTTLDKAAIKLLKDNDLRDKYIDVLVELEAANIFHQTSGFRPQDYIKHKALIKYRILLEQEIRKRGLEAPGIEGRSKDGETSQKNNKDEILDSSSQVIK